MAKTYYIFLLGIIIFVFAFRESLNFEEQVIRNYDAFVRNFPSEKLYVHADKHVYTVGEHVWFRVYGVHALTNEPGIPSRFVYVDLVDLRDSLVQQVKVGLRDSYFYGELVLPKDLQMGDYYLRAYTYNLQKQGGEYIFGEKITIVQPKGNRVQTEVSCRKEKNGYMASIKFMDRSG